MRRDTSIGTMVEYPARRPDIMCGSPREHGGVEGSDALFGGKAMRAAARVPLDPASCRDTLILIQFTLLHRHQMVVPRLRGIRWVCIGAAWGPFSFLFVLAWLCW